MRKSLARMLEQRDSTLQVWLGTLVDENSRFSREIDHSYFYGAFSALYKRATCVGDIAERTLLYYDATPLIKVYDGTNSIYWIDLQRTSVPKSFAHVVESKFDARMKTTREVTVPEPFEILQAKMKADRIKHPMRDERTRKAYAHMINYRRGRSLSFARCAAWKIHFVELHVSELRFTIDDNNNGAHTYHHEPMYLEIILECVDCTSPSVFGDLRRALVLLTTCLGTTDADVQDHLDEAQLRTEMQSMQSY